MPTKLILPREHDSFSELAINGERLLLRFTYNDTFDSWSFGLYEAKRTPILTGIKIAANFPLNLFLSMRRFEGVFFFAETRLERIGYGGAPFSFPAGRI